MQTTTSTTNIIAGVMSGTSSEGCDTVIACFSKKNFSIVGFASMQWPSEMRKTILALNTTTRDEIERSQQLGIQLAKHYAHSVREACKQTDIAVESLKACVVHGQTIRHQPEKGYSVQCVNMAHIAEILQIDVIGDFRSRDIAAGGQGAPLACGFHQWYFSHLAPCAILNLGGIANITLLLPNVPTVGFDCGPANVLLDYVMERHYQQRYDNQGRIASNGSVCQPLLQKMLAHPFFSKMYPKSTGREDFHPQWLHQQLDGFSLPLEDIMATLVALCAQSVGKHLALFPQVRKVIACGGGVYNCTLMQYIAQAITPCQLETTDKYDVPSNLVEPLAFAWMGWRTMQRKSANLPHVTGAKAARVLGCIYPG